MITMKVFGVNRTVGKLKKYVVSSEDALYKNLQRALILIENEAKRLITSGYFRPAIKTGALRNSVTSRIVEFSSKRITGEAGTGVGYDFYVHDGTKYMKKRPYLTDALKNKRNEIRELIRSSFTLKNEKFVTGSKFRGR